MATNDKKNSFLDRLSGKVSEGFKTNPGDIIHEGISDDELDKLLSGDISSSTNPPTNISGPAELPPEPSSKPTAFSNAMAEDLPEQQSVSNVRDAFVVESDETTLTEIKNDLASSSIDLGSVDALSNDSGTTTLDTIDLELDTGTASLDNETPPTLSNEMSNEVSDDLLDAIDLPDTSVSAITHAENIPSNDNSIDIDSMNSTNADVVNTDAPQAPADADAIALTLETADTDEQSDSPVTDLVFDTSASSSESDTTQPIEKDTSDSLSSSVTAAASSTSAGKTIGDTMATTPSPKASPQPTNKPSTTLGKNTMTEATQNNQLEKIQTDIDELKRKLHAMSTEYYNAATDSATLIGQLRELESGTADDFTGTYTQARELRKILIDARKLFTELPITIDMLEEALETDLYAAKK